MKAFAGYKSELMNSRPRQLPAGAYVARIKGVKIEGDEPDQMLILRLDVCEGEYTDFFLNKYKAEKEKGTYEPRYKGDFKLRIPNDENTRALYPESDKKRFKDAMARIEKSNEGYKFEWEEQTLVGKIVGINMQEDEYNDRPFTRIGRLEIADDVRNGTVKPMPPRQRKGDAYEPPVVDQQSGFVSVETDELPF